MFIIPAGQQLNNESRGVGGVSGVSSSIVWPLHGDPVGATLKIQIHWSEHVGGLHGTQFCSTMCTTWDVNKRHLDLHGRCERSTLHLIQTKADSSEVSLHKRCVELWDRRGSSLSHREFVAETEWLIYVFYTFSPVTVTHCEVFIIYGIINYSEPEQHWAECHKVKVQNWLQLRECKETTCGKDQHI